MKPIIKSRNVSSNFVAFLLVVGCVATAAACSAGSTTPALRMEPQTNTTAAEPETDVASDTTGSDTTGSDTTGSDTTGSDTTGSNTTGSNNTVGSEMEQAEEAEQTAETAEAAETEQAAGSDVEQAVDIDRTVSVDVMLVADGLTSPVFVTHAGDGSERIFVVEQPGSVRIIQDGQLLPNPFLDIRNIVRDQSNEQGLLGLAFAPDYVESGHFFVNYTDANGATTIARYQRSETDANLADTGSQSIVLVIDQPAGNHNGGMIAFGPDGYFYIGTGDGGAANDRFGNGQNPNSLLGKMLRIDVTSDPTVPYTIPADNPWVSADWQGDDGRSVDILDEIWAMGLRNPWRYSFDRATDDLWIGDVGQNQFEEIHFTPSSALSAGAIQPLNYGWPIMEGYHCFSPSSNCDMSGLVQPVAEYDHAGHCSVTGGYVYRGERFEALNGVYFYGDFCSGVVWAMWPQGDGAWEQDEVLKSQIRISSFGEDEVGELYLADRGGSIYMLTAN